MGSLYDMGHRNSHCTPNTEEFASEEMVECHVVQNGDEAIIKRQRERPQRELDVDFYDATAHLCLDEHLL
jgi:hypothetical protein